MHVPAQGDRATLGEVSWGQYRTCVVELARLEDIFRIRRLPVPKIVKINCEGMEYSVIQGMESFLRTSQPPVIAFEYIDELAKEFGASLPGLLDSYSAVRRAYTDFSGSRKAGG